MERAPLNKQLLLKNLEIAVNKQVTVSTCDRFGKDNSLFKAQFQFTTDLIKAQQHRESESHFQKKVAGLDSRIKQKQSEISSLSSVDLRKFSYLEKLTERVEELKDILEVELPDDGGIQDELSGVQSDVDNVILNWRLEAMPRCPTS
ncbi:hypothetical protein KM546_gp31 [Porcine lymphotropic herpesvirus 3]|uniref:Tegument protein UL14 n=1 Tax=Suid gammaherpesvirus 5 TaxID=1960251 RepID=Q8B3Y7_9GAMA|nr:hypothetical protein KM546_gp31 [Porcine lymphotropic herpesvirus 3]AAO12338.1 unknown [Porcine lymphotropic herpesvirus 3]